MSKKVTLDDSSFDGSLRPRSVDREAVLNLTRVPRKRLSEEYRRPVRVAKPVQPVFNSSSPRMTHQTTELGDIDADAKREFTNQLPEKSPEQSGEATKSRPRNSLILGRRQLLTGLIILAMIGIAFVATRSALSVQTEVKSFNTQVRKFTLDEPSIDTGQAVVEELKADAVEKYVATKEAARVLYIPKLGLEARVIDVARTKAGAVALPDNIFDVGLFGEGSDPASTKGAILLSGYNKGPTTEGALANLDTLEEGDLIKLELGSGKIMTFRVITVDIVLHGNVDMASAVESVDPYSLGLNLLDYNPSSNDRVLVRTQLVEVN